MGVKQRSKSLKSRGLELSNTFYQLEVLNSKEIANEHTFSFAEKISEHGYKDLRPSGLDIFQLNIGKLCNQSCAHCHVDAGPDRKLEILMYSV